MLKRSGPSIEQCGIPKIISGHVCYICYQSLLVVSSLRNNYKLVLVSLKAISMQFSY